VAHKTNAEVPAEPACHTFPIEFRVEDQYVHFGQILLQPAESQRWGPHVVMAEKNVSTIALEALSEHNAAVARAVKPFVISFVARATQADVFSFYG
jgi:1-phosphatidylinositol-3-phosphate 5-kinase